LPARMTARCDSTLGDWLWIQDLAGFDNGAEEECLAALSLEVPGCAQYQVNAGEAAGYKQTGSAELLVALSNPVADEQEIDIAGRLRSFAGTRSKEDDLVRAQGLRKKLDVGVYCLAASFCQGMDSSRRG